MLSICTTSHSTGNNVISVFIHPSTKFYDNDSDHWTIVDTAIRLLAQQWRSNFVFGFHSRHNMLQFLAAVVNTKLTSLSRRGTVRYAVACKEKREGDYREREYWYRAFLECDQPRGIFTTSLFSSHTDLCAAGDGVDNIGDVYTARGCRTPASPSREVGGEHLKTLLRLHLTVTAQISMT